MKRNIFWILFILASTLSAIVHAQPMVQANSQTSFKAKDFINNKLAYLDSIRPLREPWRKALVDSFYLYTATDSNYNRTFNKAMKKIITDTLYYIAIAHDNIRKAALTASTRAMKEMARKYSLTEEVVKKIEPFLYAEKLAMVELDNRMKEESLLKDSLKQLIYDTLNDNVNAILVRYGYKKPQNRITSALANGALLGLSEAQKDALQACQVELCQLARAFVGKTPLDGFDKKPFIVARLPSILTPEQYYKQLLLEAQVPAYRDTQHNWDELRKYNLTENLDSVATDNLLMEYNLKRVMTSWLNGEEGRQLKPEYKALLPTPGAIIQPALLHKLDVAKKMGYTDPAKHTLTW